MRIQRLSRRTFLRGTGGLMLYLPVLEIMLSPHGAFAQAAAPKRYGQFFIGQSLGADNDPRNYLIPTTLGTNYASTVGLKPLFDRNLQNDYTFVSKLRIPVGSGNGQRIAGFHKVAHYPVVTGARQDRQGASADVILEGVLGAGRLFPSLRLSGQPNNYRDNEIRPLSVSFNNQGNFLAPNTNPAAAFDSLFGNFTPPNNNNNNAGNAQALALAAEIRRRRVSVLDQILGDRDQLVKKLGANDRARLTQHLDQVRDLERRIQAVEVPAENPVPVQACMTPNKPTINGTTNFNQGYSNEDGRNAVFMDLIYMAYACDLTAVVSHTFLSAQCFMEVQAAGINTGYRFDVHEQGHGGIAGGGATPPLGTPYRLMTGNGNGLPNGSSSWGMAFIHQWSIKHFAALLERMKNTPEGAGTMLDNSALMLFFEGGHGGNTDNGDDFGSHSTENMVALVAGRAGGLRPQGHIEANNAHPAQVTLAAMKAVGYQGNSLGEVSGAFNLL